MSCLSQVVGAAEFLELALHDYNQLFNGFSLVEDVAACTLILHAESFKESLLVAFEKIEQDTILLHDMLHIVLEHDLSEICSNDLGQCLPAQHLAYHVFLRTNSHLPHRVVIE